MPSEPSNKFTKLLRGGHERDLQLALPGSKVVWDPDSETTDVSLMLQKKHSLLLRFDKFGSLVALVHQGKQDFAQVTLNPKTSTFEVHTKFRKLSPTDISLLKHLGVSFVWDLNPNTVIGFKNGNRKHPEVQPMFTLTPGSRIKIDLVENYKESAMVALRKTFDPCLLENGITKAYDYKVL